MRLTFKVVRVGELFTHNGNLYQKRSGRTAHLIAYNRTFYMQQMAECTL